VINDETVAASVLVQGMRYFDIVVVPIAFLCRLDTDIKKYLRSKCKLYVATAYENEDYAVIRKGNCPTSWSNKMPVVDTNQRQRNLKRRKVASDGETTMVNGMKSKLVEFSAVDKARFYHSMAQAFTEVSLQMGYSVSIICKKRVCPSSLEEGSDVEG
jgi:hypothetical protein